ncbi:MAG: WD40 repeat domain-containing protein [Pirellulales bacterium]
MLRVVRAATLETTVEYHGHTSRVTALVFTPDGRGLVSISDDRTAKVWDVPGVREPRLVEADEFKTFAVAYSPNGRLLASGGADGVVRITDLTAVDESAKPRELRGHGAAVRVVRFVNDDKILTGAEDNTARLWDLKDGKELRSWPHDAWVQDLVVVPHHGMFFTADANGVIRRFATEGPATVTPERKWQGHDSAIHAIAADSRPRDYRWALLATAARGGSVKLCSISGEPIATLIADHEVVSLSFSPDGKTLAGGDDSGNVTLWDVAAQTVRIRCAAIVAESTAWRSRPTVARWPRPPEVVGCRPAAK